MSEGAATFPDGSNLEGADPVPPLGWSTKADLKNIKVYGLKGSPTCAKLMMLLEYCGIEYELVQGLNKPGSDYKKMPVIDVDGRQVNDTYIIHKYLAPLALGKEAQWDDDMEKQLTRQLPAACEFHMGISEFNTWAGHSKYGFGMPAFVFWIFGWLIYEYVLMKPNIQKQLDSGAIDPLRTPKEVLEDFKKKMKGPFYAGAKISSADISCFGNLAPFLLNELPSVMTAIKEAGLEDWVAAMQKEFPLTKFYPMD